MIRAFLSISLIFIPATSFAFFCPNNFNQIDYGASVEQVTTQCGTPPTMETKEVKREGPQEWSFFIPQTVGTQALSPMTGTLKTQMTFDAEGKAINISVNGIGVGSTSICGSTIRLGDSRDTIKAACGQPAFVNRQEGTSSLGGTPPPDKVTTLIYPGARPTTLIFVNGILTEKQQ